jgi:hypothetical protein
MEFGPYHLIEASRADLRIRLFSKKASDWESQMSPVAVVELQELLPAEVVDFPVPRHS